MNRRNSTNSILVRSFTVANVLTLTLLRCGGGEPPHSLKVGVRSTQPSIVVSVTDVPSVGLIHAAERCDEGFVVAGDSAVVLDDKFRVLRSLWKPSYPAIQPQLSILVRHDCSGYLLRRDSSQPANIYHLFALDGTPLRDFPLEHQGSALLVVHRRNPVVVKTEDHLGIVAYDAMSGTLERNLSEVATGDLIAGDLADSEDSEVVSVQGNEAVIHALDGSVLGSVAGPIRSVAVAAGLDATKSQLLVQRDDSVESFDGRGKLLSRYRIPNLEQFSYIVGSAATEQALAILLGGRGGWHRTILLIYERGGNLARYEILDGDFLVVMAVKEREFAVFGRNKVVTVSGVGGGGQSAER